MALRCSGDHRDRGSDVTASPRKTVPLKQKNTATEFGNFLLTNWADDRPNSDAPLRGALDPIGKNRGRGHQMTTARKNILRRDPSPEMLKTFLEGRPEAAQQLAHALKSPDVRLVRDNGQPAAPVVTAPGVTMPQDDVAQAAPTLQPIVDTAPVQEQEVRIAPVIAESPVAAPAPADPVPVTDHASISVPEKASPTEQARKHRRWGNRKMASAIDMTMSMDPAHAERLTELAAYEMLRTKTKVSVSEVVRHLLDFALAHVDGNRVIPTDDGLGLHTPAKEA